MPGASCPCSRRSGTVAQAQRWGLAWGYGSTERAELTWRHCGGSPVTEAGQLLWPRSTAMKLQLLAIGDGILRRCRVALPRRLELRLWPARKIVELARMGSVALCAHSLPGYVKASELWKIPSVDNADGVLLSPCAIAFPTGCSVSVTRVGGETGDELPPPFRRSFRSGRIGVTVSPHLIRVDACPRHLRRCCRWTWFCRRGQRWRVGGSAGPMKIETGAGVPGVDHEPIWCITHGYSPSDGNHSPGGCPVRCGSLSLAAES